MRLQRSDYTAIDALYRISSIVNGTEDPTEALNIILDEVVSVLKASSASISLINPETNTLNIEVNTGLPADRTSMSLPLGKGITGWVAQRGEPALVADVSKESRYVAVKSSIRSEMAVPMEDQGTVIGVVNVDSEEIGAFSEQDLKLLTLLTNEAAKVVSRLWIIRQLKAKASQLQSLINIAGRMVAKTELAEILVDIVRESRRLFKCRMCALYLLSPDGKQLSLKALVGDDDETISFSETLALPDCVMGTVVHLQKPVETASVTRTEEHHFAAFEQRDALHAMLSVPVTFEEEPIGVLNAYTGHPHRFNNDEKRLLSTVGQLGAVAIQNARLYNRVFSSEESLRKTEKLTTLGLLAAEIAHEIRNPLTVIKLLFDAMDLQFPDHDVRRQDATVISEKLNQLEEIVSRVLQFGKTRQDMHARWEVDAVIEDTILLVRLKLKQNRIAIIHKASTPPLHVQCNKGQIQQMLLNLILNATEAIIQKSGAQGRASHSRITIDTSQREIAGVDMAYVTMKDSGAGIAEEIREHIFDSFLTGKKDGTGLGLAICKRILKSHRGDIELIDSGPDGTTFAFWLPIA